MASARDVLAAAADLVLGISCGGCGAGGGRGLCDGCLAALDRVHAARPTPCPPGLPEVVAAADYAGPAGAAVRAHKEEGRLSLARPLGSALAAAVAAACPDPHAPLVLVPVPSPRSRVRRRGHDPLLRVARCAALRLRASGRDVRVLPVLSVRRRVLDQSGLDAVGRWDNLAGALVLAPPRARLLDGRRVVVVDDVMTTGATLAEAARAVRAAGLEVAGGAVVAATQRRSPEAAPRGGPEVRRVSTASRPD